MPTTTRKKAKAKVSVPRPATIMRCIKTPPDFKRSLREQEEAGWGSVKARKFPVLTLEKPDDVKIEIRFDGRRESSYLASATVEFNTPQGWRSFDRYGVEDSFYLSNPAHWPDPQDDPAVQANAAIRRYLDERIPERRARLANSESVPGVPFMVTPESKQQISKRLKAGQSHSFTPSGFGTGYRLSTRNSRYAKPSPATAEFFGLKAVYVETFDAD